MSSQREVLGTEGWQMLQIQMLEKQAGVGAMFCVAMAEVRQEGGARPGLHQRGQPLLGGGQSQVYISSPNLPYSTQISLL